ncbi:glycoside hydrolase family 5 protein [Desertibaculum subflavum]|uniref:glycoside hydrolase family 5 protein n=1 Tax=Desertibaculum subflavum TaxID=2268458 RepID=UPI0013C4C575
MRFPLRLLSLILALLTFPAAADDGFIRIDGRRFVAPDGSTFLIKGINFGNWLMPEGYMFKFEKMKSPRQIEAVMERLLGPAEAAAFWRRFRDTYIAEADIRFIKSVGFNTIRIPLHWKHFVVPGTPPRFEGEGYALLDRVIGWAGRAGLRVIMDMHAAPGGQTGINHDDGPGYPLMFYVPAHRALTIALWRHLAARYRDERAVLGYDILNEPISPYHDMAYLNPRLEPFYLEATAAIRGVNANHVVFWAGAQWSTNFEVFGRPSLSLAGARNIAFTYHKFWSSTERDAIQSYLNYGNRYDVPLLLGESGELTDEWTEAFRRLHERHGVGWAFWTYKNLDSGSTVVSIPRPAGWEAVTAFGNRFPRDWPKQADDAAARQALAGYLDSVVLARGKVNWSYLAALGLRGSPLPDDGEAISTR